MAMSATGFMLPPGWCPRKRAHGGPEGQVAGPGLPYLTCEAGDEADESSIERRVLAALGGIASAALARSGDLNPEMLSGIRRARTFFEGMP